MWELVSDILYYTLWSHYLLQTLSWLKFKRQQDELSWAECAHLNSNLTSKCEESEDGARGKTKN